MLFLEKLQSAACKYTEINASDGDFLNTKNLEEMIPNRRTLGKCTFLNFREIVNTRFHWECFFSR